MLNAIRNINNNNNNTNAPPNLEKPKWIIACCIITFAIGVAALATDFARLDSVRVGLFVQCYKWSGSMVCVHYESSMSTRCPLFFHMTNLSKMGGIWGVINLFVVAVVNAARLIQPSLYAEEVEHRHHSAVTTGRGGGGGGGGATTNANSNFVSCGGVVVPFLASFPLTVNVPLFMVAFIGEIVAFTAVACDGATQSFMSFGYTIGPSAILFAICFVLAIVTRVVQGTLADPEVAPAATNQHANNINNNNNNTNNNNNNGLNTATTFHPHLQLQPGQLQQQQQNYQGHAVVGLVVASPGGAPQFVPYGQQMQPQFFSVPQQHQQQLPGYYQQSYYTPGYYPSGGSAAIVPSFPPPAPPA